MIQAEEINVQNPSPLVMDNSQPLITFTPKNNVSVDEWVPEPEDNIFRHINKYMILPVSNYYCCDNIPSLDYFVLNPKRCYNRPEMREHMVQYLNYFEKFYDTDHELVVVYYQLKYILDFTPEYSKFSFINDLTKYILYNRSLLKKIYIMNEDNYEIELIAKKGRSVTSLQYTTAHGKILMMMSLLQCMVIPLVTHFIHINKMDNVDEVLLEVFDIILDLSSVDMYNKMYETSSSEVKKSQSIHSLWNMQDIRARNATTHVMSSIENIVLNIMPKYIYSQNVVSFNYTSIRMNTGYKITDIRYEFNFTMLSSSNRDADEVSDVDRFESFLTRQSESLYMQNKVNAQETMEEIELHFGPFDPEEIQFYIKNLENVTDGNIINRFQRELLFNLFSKYFGDPTSIQAIDNKESYVKLMIAAKRMLECSNLVVMPYIIGGSKVIRTPNRKGINKKELLKLQASQYWEDIKRKYGNNEKVMQMIMDQIAVILSSEFKIFDMHDDELNGKVVEINSDWILEEYSLFVLLI